VHLERLNRVRKSIKKASLHDNVLVTITLCTPYIILRAIQITRFELLTQQYGIVSIYRKVSSIAGALVLVDTTAQKFLGTPKDIKSATTSLSHSPHATHDLRPHLLRSSKLAYILASPLTPPLRLHCSPAVLAVLASLTLFYSGFYPASSSLYIRFLALRLNWPPSSRCASLTAMSTYLGDSSDHSYTSVPMSKSSSSTSNTTIPTSPEETSLIEGLEDISPTAGLEGIHKSLFDGIPNMRKIVKSQYNKLQNGDSAQQYLVFERVSVDDLTKIDHAFNNIGIHTRTTHYTDENLLIVKLPTAEHEAAHLKLGMRVMENLVLMGMSLDEFHPVGATRIRGRLSSKEADSAYRPYSFRPNKTDWPTIVFEAGLSESLRRLRLDAKWWLIESGGDVKTVIIMSVKPAQSMIHIEKWELAPVAGSRPNTRAFSTLNIPPPPPQMPTQIQVITIDPNTVTGAPLVLEFEKIFLRPAVLPESNITFTAQELLTWAARVW
jgi:hypothetical protein